MISPVKPMVFQQRENDVFNHEESGFNQQSFAD